jgi:hypothetical protein
LALSSTGQVYAWGYNHDGQLGDNNAPTDAHKPVAVSAGLIPPGTKIIQVAAGSGHSLALSSTGQVYAWGYDDDGELGDAPMSPADEPAPVPVSYDAEMPPGTKIIQIAAGSLHSLALSSTGQVYAWGSNAQGQLGDNAAEVSSWRPVAVSLPAGTTVDSLALGPESNHVLAVIGDLAVATGALPAGTVGFPYSVTLAATGGVGADNWSASGLPAGLSINATSGAITGTPTAAGTASVTVSVSDTNGLTASRSLSLATTTFAAAAVSVNQKNGALTFTQPTTGPGKLSWTLTFPNGTYGAFAARKHKRACKTAQIKLAGKCRPTMVGFASGSESITAAGNATFTATPSRSATRALKTALTHHKGLRVTATLSFQSTLGGVPVSNTQTVADKLNQAKRQRKHKK